MGGMNLTLTTNTLPKTAPHSPQTLPHTSSNLPYFSSKHHVLNNLAVLQSLLVTPLSL